MKQLLPFIYFRDASGEPLAGGKVYTYTAGSSTLKATYVDANGDHEHTNPVILGSDGSTRIWLDTDEPYKLSIYDKNDTQIGSSIDNVRPTLSRALSSGGSDLDMTGYSIVTTANDDIRLSPNGTGQVKISDAYFLPTTTPSQNAVLTGGSTTDLVWSTPGAYTLDGLSDVSITAAASGNLLKYNAGTWVNIAQSTLSFTTSQVTDIASATVAFTNKTGAISQWTNDSAYITASSSNTLTNKSGNISQWTNNAGYHTEQTAASQAQAEAAIADTVFMPPSKMKNHPGVAKAWIYGTRTSLAFTTVASYNVSSVTQLDQYFYDINFTTAFSSASYVVIDNSPAGDTSSYASANKTASKTRIGFNGLSNMSVFIMFFGDQ